ncbi:MAG: DUF3019 domain-containing protein [Colwellia sp.]
MYSSVCKGITLLVFILINSVISSSKAAENTTLTAQTNFSVHPQQCVTLRQGRDCFATIVMKWQKTSKTSLCLYQINKKRANSQKKLVCWIKKNDGNIKVEFESSENLTYQLRTLKDQLLIAETEIVVSWVHKNTSRKRRWRLF